MWTMKHPRIFKDPVLLNEMLGFRRQGYTYDDLAQKYNVDRTSIKHWCDQYQLGGDILSKVREFYKEQGVKLNRAPRILVIDLSLATEWTEDEVGERVHRGKSYQEYLDEEKKRTNPTRNKYLESYYKSKQIKE